MLELNKLYLMDCMEGMKQIPDKYFELAIIDPPYGGGSDAIDVKDNIGLAKQATTRTTYKQFENTEPPKEYWEELFRVSREQIIWGSNYYTNINLSGGLLVWDKKGTVFGRAEVAYLSMRKSVNIFEYTWNGMLQENMKNKEMRIHPTQKPTSLYRYLLQNYAKEGDKILDTHVGSGSSLIACYDLGFDYMGFEIDPDYWSMATMRIADFKSQVRFEI